MVNGQGDIKSKKTGKRFRGLGNTFDQNGGMFADKWKGKLHYLKPVEPWREKEWDL